MKLFANKWSTFEKFLFRVFLVSDIGLSEIISVFLKSKLAKPNRTHQRRLCWRSLRLFFTFYIIPIIFRFFLNVFPPFRNQMHPLVLLGARSCLCHDVPVLSFSARSLARLFPSFHNYFCLSQEVNRGHAAKFPRAAGAERIRLVHRYLQSAKYYSYHAFLVPRALIC